jgi:hypothetical protein
LVIYKHCDKIWYFIFVLKGSLNIKIHVIQTTPQKLKMEVPRYIVSRIFSLKDLEDFINISIVHVFYRRIYLVHWGRRSRNHALRLLGLCLATWTLIYLASLSPPPPPPHTSILIQNKLHIQTRDGGAILVGDGEIVKPATEDRPGEMGRPVVLKETSDNDSDIREVIEAGYKVHAFNLYVRKVLCT